MIFVYAVLPTRLHGLLPLFVLTRFLLCLFSMITKHSVTPSFMFGGSHTFDDCDSRASWDWLPGWVSMEFSHILVVEVVPGLWVGLPLCLAGRFYTSDLLHVISGFQKLGLRSSSIIAVSVYLFNDRTRVSFLMGGGWESVMFLNSFPAQVPLRSGCCVGGSEP